MCIYIYIHIELDTRLSLCLTCPIQVPPRKNEIWTKARLAGLGIGISDPMEGVRTVFLIHGTIS